MSIFTNALWFGGTAAPTVVTYGIYGLYVSSDALISIQNIYLQIASVTGLTFNFQTTGTPITVVQGNVTNRSYAYYPSNTNPNGSDVYLSTAHYSVVNGAKILAVHTGGTFAYADLLHEIGHSLGLTHVHNNDNPSDYTLGLANLRGTYTYFLGDGTSTYSTANLYRAWFTMMSYDYGSRPYELAPMIEDVIVLGEKYGIGSHNSENSVYSFGNSSFILGRYKTIVDTGGLDTIDLSDRTYSMHIELGRDIGATYKVGIVVSENGWSAIHNTNGGDPGSLNWLYGNFENAVGGSGNDVINGNSLENSLTGGAGNDSLDGGGGNDTISGGIGNDNLTGGSGVDLFNITSGTDTITDLGSGGADVLVVSSGATVNATLGDAWTASSGSSNAGIANIITVGMPINLSAITTGLGYNVNNKGGATTITGSGLADTLFGGSGNDILIGGLDNDTLSGGIGNDTLTGGSGIDFFNITSGVDTITDLGSGGADVLVVSSGATVNATLGAAWTATSSSVNSGSANISTSGIVINLIAITSGFGYVVSNSGGATTITGSGLSDSLIGGDGNDSLNGGAGNDLMTGGAGDDLFDWDAYGRGGNDTMIGGSGNDQYVVNGTGDVIVEDLNGGDDLIWTPVNYSLANIANVERLSIYGSDAINITGNALANVLNGNDSANIISGADGADTLNGRDGNDTLIGGSGNDSLYGAEGSDTLIGGQGNDSIVLTEITSVSDTLVFSGGNGTIGTVARVASLGMDSIIGINLGTNTTSVDKLQFSSADFGITAGAATRGSASAIIGGPLANSDGNLYIVSLAPTGVAVDLNGNKTANNGAIVCVGSALGTDGVSIWFTVNEGSFSTSNSVKIAMLIGINTANLNATDVVFIA